MADPRRCAVRRVAVVDPGTTSPATSSALRSRGSIGDDVYWLEGRPAKAAGGSSFGRRSTARRPTSPRRQSTSGPAFTNTAVARTPSPAGSSSTRSSPTAGCIGSIRGPTSRSRSRPRGRCATRTSGPTWAGRRCSPLARTTQGPGSRSHRSSPSRSTAPARRSSSRRAPIHGRAPPVTERDASRLARVGPPGHAVGCDPVAGRSLRA